MPLYLNRSAIMRRKSVMFQHFGIDGEDDQDHYGPGFDQDPEDLTVPHYTMADTLWEKWGTVKSWVRRALARRRPSGPKPELVERLSLSDSGEDSISVEAPSQENSFLLEVLREAAEDPLVGLDQPSVGNETVEPSSGSDHVREIVEGRWSNTYLIKRKLVAQKNSIVARVAAKVVEACEARSSSDGRKLPAFFVRMLHASGLLKVDKLPSVVRRPKSFLPTTVAHDYEHLRPRSVTECECSQQRAYYASTGVVVDFT